MEQLGWAAPDGRRVPSRFRGPTFAPIESSAIRMRGAPKATANSADDEILRMVRDDDRPFGVTVATSDATLADRVRGEGACMCPAARFRDLIDPLPSVSTTPGGILGPGGVFQGVSGPGDALAAFVIEAATYGPMWRVAG